MLARNHPRLRVKRRSAATGPAFAPTQISAITSILDVATATVTGAGVSSLPDLLNVNPAVQGTDAKRPPRVASAGNGTLLLQPNDDTLTLPAIAANNQLVTWGFATFLRLDDLITTKYLLRYGPTGAFDPAATDSLNLRILGNEGVFIQVFTNALGTAARSAQTASGALNSSAYTFVTVEFNGNLAAEADRVVITIDGVVQTLSFGNSVGAPGAMPAALQGQPVGTDIVLFSEIASGFTPYLGSAGPKIYFFGAAMAGVTQGLLTAGARQALSAFQRPT